MKLVNKEEFDEFIKNYPKKLKFDFSMIYDPPFCTYNDFTLGNYPESIVASFIADGSYKYDFKIKEK